MPLCTAWNWRRWRRSHTSSTGTSVGFAHRRRISQQRGSQHKRGTLLGAPGIATSNKKLLGAPGLTTSKDATSNKGHQVD